MPPEQGDGVATTGDTPNTETKAADTAGAWYAGLDAETIGHVQNRGWHEKTAAEAAGEAVKAYRELEHFRGIPGDQIARVPKDAADEAGWLALRTRLGVPNDPAMYDFSAVKKADGTEVDPGVVAFARETAAALHLPKGAEADLLSRIIKQTESTATAEATERTAAITTEREALKANWGANFDAHMLAAKAAATALGVTSAEVDTLEKTIGYAKVMNMFQNIATKIGEDKFVSAGGNGNPADVNGVGLLTVEQATARKADLMADSAFVARATAGDVAAQRELLALNTIIVGDDTAASRGA